MSTKDDNLYNEGPAEKKHKNDGNMAGVEQGVTESAAAQAPPRFFSTSSAPEYLQSELLYERKPVTDLWNKLTAVAKPQWKWRATTEKFFIPKKRVLQVYGPPGTGKSSATFYWVSRVCTDLNAKCLWINCANIREESKCWSIAKEKEKTAVQVSKETVPSLRDAEKTAADYNIVIFDGVREATLTGWRGSINRLAELCVFVVLVSSEGVRMHSGDSNHLLNQNHLVSSWTEEEYYASCSSDKFWTTCYRFFAGASATNNHEARRKLLDKKFEVSGQSARYMFRWESDKVETRIAHDAASMGGITALEGAANSYGSSGAVNSLISRMREGSNGVTPKDEARFPTSDELAPSGATRWEELWEAKEEKEPNTKVLARLVSSFASKKVVERLPSEIAKLRDVARALDNEAIEGYALEEQLKKSLKEASHPGVKLAIEVEGKMKGHDVAKFLVCKKTGELESLLADGQPNGTWIFMGGQQGAFDAVHLVSSNEIRFVQTTAGASHTFKLDLVRTVLNNLAKLPKPKTKTWRSVEFMVMRPSDDYRTFSLGTARGTLRGYTDFKGQSWDRSDERANVVYSRLPWSD